MPTIIFPFYYNHMEYINRRPSTPTSFRYMEEYNMYFIQIHSVL